MARLSPPMASARIQRWALILGAYQYCICYQPGKDIGDADCLSCLPLPDHPPDVPIPGEILLAVDKLSQSPVSAKDIHTWTSKDSVLSSVQRFIMNGWPDKVSQPDLLPYFSKRSELSLDCGCIFRGSRVVVPPPGRQAILRELHEAHPGICHIKSLARGYVWWPGIDADLEDVVKRCNTCQMFRNSPPSAPIHPWHFPEHPWTRIHIDFAGPFLGKMFLVIIDAHSKWMETHTMTSSTNASATIDKLRQTFAIFGLPHELVSDNAPVFASQSFQIFMSENGIKHIRAAPHHPASNGLTERAVQTFKIGMKKLSGPLETKLSRFLFAYHTTLQTSTGLAPAQLMFGRRLRTRLDLLFPHSSVVDSVRKSQERMIVSRQGRKLHVFEPQDLVYCQDFKSAKPSWCPAKVVSKTGPLSYQIQMRDGRITKRHVDHLMQRSAISEVDETNDEILVSPSSLGKLLNGFLRMFHPKRLGARGSYKDVQLGPDNPQIAMFLLGEGEDVTLNIPQKLVL